MFISGILAAMLYPLTPLTRALFRFGINLALPTPVQGIRPLIQERPLCVDSDEV
jgi:hypothetical protein